MQRFLLLSAADQRLSFTQTAERRGLVASSVEKDFWVCWTLGQLFSLPGLASHLTFKGGTSLSKAWGLIDRFSEDIDLTIARTVLGFGGESSPERAPSGKQRAKRLKALKAACRAYVEGPVKQALEERTVAVLGNNGWTLTLDADDPDGQTLLFNYPSHFQVLEGRYVAPTVKIEFGARADPWPTEARVIRPIVAEVLPQAFVNAGYPVQALLPKRTFWEKAMLLHEETFRPANKPRRARMARHYYDLHRLIEQGVGEDASNDTELFAQAAQHRQVFFAQSWVDYTTLKPGTLRLAPLPEQEASWREDYAAMQREMFSVAPPTFAAILATIGAFETQFNARALSRPVQPRAP